MKRKKLLTAASLSALFLLAITVNGCASGQIIRGEVEMAPLTRTNLNIIRQNGIGLENFDFFVSSNITLERSTAGITAFPLMTTSRGIDFTDNEINRIVSIKGNDEGKNWTPGLARKIVSDISTGNITLTVYFNSQDPSKVLTFQDGQMPNPELFYLVYDTQPTSDRDNCRGSLIYGSEQYGVFYAGVDKPYLMMLTRWNTVKQTYE
ncbi:MAG: hypothetical protein LBM77_05480 [Spirochaetaceae bacterium]|jgi:hypothetical protein|nr:hypothetical protein [Spirochaetaceae bacterium]